MRKTGQRAILVGNVGWMARYQGLHNCPDKIVGGGKFVVENGHGHECCNFLASRHNLVYGHFETIKKNVDRQVKIERLGANPSSSVLEHVDVVWVATHPQQRGRRVVGYYLDATVYRRRQEHPKFPSVQHRADQIGSFMVKANAENAMLLSLDQRDIALGSGPGWIGQANWWFPETSTHRDVPAFLRKVRALLAGHGDTASSRRTPRKWGGPTDPYRNALVEEAAITAVREHFSNYAIRSVEKENRGWDLEMFDGSDPRKGTSPVLLVEVKGLSSSALQVSITPNEFKALDRHRNGKLPNYRLCVVTDALSLRPRLHILKMPDKRLGWIDDRTGRRVRLDVKPMTGAIVSMT